MSAVTDTQGLTDLSQCAHALGMAFSRQALDEPDIGRKVQFVELFNRGSTPASLGGWSIQYASATGTGNFSASVTPLPEVTVPAGGYFLVQFAGGANGAPLPTPDAVGTANPAASAGKIVVATSDAPALVRLRAAFAATRIAEWFRDRGAHVNLLMDSLTRFAMAQREIGLSAGEPPTTRGYPPSVFAKLPQLVERAGNGADGRGSITAFYTVLTEGDDQQEPIADAARAILDGHIVLTRRIADAGQYPAIDVEVSVSRVMQDITDAPWRERIRRLKRLMAAHSAQRDLIAIGAYQRGSDPAVDEAVARWPAIQAFLGQDVAEASDVAASRAALAALLDDGPAAVAPNRPQEA